MSEELKEDWLLVQIREWERACFDRSDTKITYKEHNIPSLGDTLWMEEGERKRIPKQRESLFPYGFSPLRPLNYID